MGVRLKGEVFPSQYEGEFQSRLKKTPALHASELNVVGNPNDGLASQPGGWAGGNTPIGEE